jgi:hypothetical protein
MTGISLVADELQQARRADRTVGVHPDQGLAVPAIVGVRCPWLAGDYLPDHLLAVRQAKPLAAASAHVRSEQLKDRLQAIWGDQLRIPPAPISHGNIAGPGQGTIEQRVGPPELVVSHQLHRCAVATLEQRRVVEALASKPQQCCRDRSHLRRQPPAPLCVNLLAINSLGELLRHLAQLLDGRLLLGVDRVE